MAHLNKSDTLIKTISLFLLFIIIITLLYRTLNAGAVALIDASCIIVLGDYMAYCQHSFDHSVEASGDKGGPSIGSTADMEIQFIWLLLFAFQCQFVRS